ncbi:MAG: 30S ribosome-binding factor RbfA [Kiritimatiellia bacterium]
MKTDRLIRVNELMKREIGEYLSRTITVDRDGFDRSILTVTHVMVSTNLQAARVMVSIFGHEKQRNAILSALRRHRCDVQKEIAHKMVLKYTPRLSFELDTSLAEGDRILSLLDTIKPIKEESGGPDSGAADS